MKLYRSLAGWYRLIDPPADHAGEVRAYREAIERAAPAAKTLLELGSGAGHNAVHLVDRFEVTLNDLSEEMLALSRDLHPSQPHHHGDLRTLRLGKTFDAVLLHDAVMYLIGEGDLRSALQTVNVHLADGGVAVLAMDVVRDQFVEHTDLLEEDDGTRSMRGIAWAWDPDPTDDSFVTDYVFMLRDGSTVETVHDHHVEGFFTRATWERLARETGFTCEWFARPLDEEGAFDEVLLIRKGSD